MQPICVWLFKCAGCPTGPPLPPSPTPEAGPGEKNRSCYVSPFNAQAYVTIQKKSHEQQMPLSLRFFEDQWPSDGLKKGSWNSLARGERKLDKVWKEPGSGAVSAKSHGK